MSNAALQSQLNSLERDLRRAEGLNSQLRGELSTISSGVSRAQKELDQYSETLRNELDRSNGKMVASHQTVIDALELQGEIAKLYTKFKAIELANKNIRACNNKKFYDFANYRTVRKIVQGMMDNIDVNMVGDAVIAKSVETQHLQTPDYWLTCVLISIMAWKNDDKPLAERAIARAIKLDKKSSAIFYMLFNLRMMREDAVLKWFQIYQQCELKGSDQRTFLMLFSLVSKTMAEQVDERTHAEVMAFIHSVIDANAKAQGYSEEQILATIRGYFNKWQPVEQLELPLLRKHCGSFNHMTSVMLQAKNNVNILEFVLRTVNVSAAHKNASLKSYIEELIAAPNQAEKDVYDEIAYNELVIKLDGDSATARERFQSEQLRKKTDINLIAEMMQWVYEKDNADVNGQTRLNMFTLTKQLQIKAVEAHVAGYRSQRRSAHPVTIDDYADTIDFEHEEEELGKVSTYYTGLKEEALSRIKGWKAYVGFGVGVAAAAGGYFAGWWLLALTVGGAGYGASVLLGNRSNRRGIERQCADKTTLVGDTMKKLFDEYRHYEQQLDEQDAYQGRIVTELNKL